MIFESLFLNLFMGITGIMLCGMSLERGRQRKNKFIILRGILELIIGTYFLIAAIGST